MFSFIIGLVGKTNIHHYGDVQRYYGQCLLIRINISVVLYIMLSNATGKVCCISRGPPVVGKPGYSAFTPIENMAVTTGRIRAMLFHSATGLFKRVEIPVACGFTK